MAMKRTQYKLIGGRTKGTKYQSTRNASITAARALNTPDAWDTASAHSQALFEDSDLTLHIPSAQNRVMCTRSVTGKTSGKYYVEITNVTTTSNATSAGVTDTFSFTNSLHGYYNRRGRAFYGSNYRIGAADLTVLENEPWREISGWNTTQDITDGDIIMLAIDLDNGLLHVGVNGTWSSDTQIGEEGLSRVGEIFHPFMVLEKGISYHVVASARSDSSPVIEGRVTANFGGSSFTYTVPAGYIAGWDTTD